MLCTLWAISARNPRPKVPSGLLLERWWAGQPPTTRSPGRCRTRKTFKTENFNIEPNPEFFKPTMTLSFFWHTVQTLWATSARLPEAWWPEPYCFWACFLCEPPFCAVFTVTRALNLCLGFSDFNLCRERRNAKICFAAGNLHLSILWPALPQALQTCLFCLRTVTGFRWTMSLALHVTTKLKTYYGPRKQEINRNVYINGWWCIYIYIKILETYQHIS